MERNLTIQKFSYELGQANAFCEILRMLSQNTPDHIKLSDIREISKERLKDAREKYGIIMDTHPIPAANVQPIRGKEAAQTALASIKEILGGAK
jgi:hypothetical protein